PALGGSNARRRRPRLLAGVLGNAADAHPETLGERRIGGAFGAQPSGLRPLLGAELGDEWHERLKGRAPSRKGLTLQGRFPGTGGRQRNCGDDSKTIARQRRAVNNIIVAPKSYLINTANSRILNELYFDTSIIAQSCGTEISGYIAATAK